MKLTLYCVYKTGSLRVKPSPLVDKTHVTATLIFYRWLLAEENAT